MALTQFDLMGAIAQAQIAQTNFAAAVYRGAIANDAANQAAHTYSAAATHMADTAHRSAEQFTNEAVNDGLTIYRCPICQDWFSRDGFYRHGC